jgi:hypothetical protein
MNEEAQEIGKINAGMALLVEEEQSAAQSYAHFDR